MRRATIGVTAVLLALSVLGLVLNMTVPAGADQTRLSEALYLCDPLVFGAVGGFLVLRRPDNAVGWMLGLVAVTGMLDSLAKAVVHHGQNGEHWAIGLVPWGAWFDNWSWLGLYGGLIVGLLRFPDGRRPGLTWRLVERASIGLCVLMAFLAAVQPTSADYPGVALPFDLGPAFQIGDTEFPVLYGLLLSAIGAGLVSLLLRRRRATGVQRAQLRWLLWAVALNLAVGVISTAVEGLGAGEIANAGLDVISQVTIWGLPVSIAVAITRHGLYEIDRVIGRTVSYTVLTVLLTAAYVAVVTVVSTLVPADLGSLAVVAATLAVAALFVPARRHVQAIVDRRFNRARFDADGVVSAFAARTRTATGQVTTEDDLMIAVRQVYQPAHVSVWLAPARSAS